LQNTDIELNRFLKKPSPVNADVVMKYVGWNDALDEKNGVRKLDGIKGIKRIF